MSKTICKHIERELSKVYAHKSLKAIPISYIDHIKEVLIEDNTKEHMFAMMEKLKNYGLPEIYCQVLTCSFVLNWSDQVIAEELGVPSRKTVFSMRSRGVELLRERGYK